MKSIFLYSVSLYGLRGVKFQLFFLLVIVVYFGFSSSRKFHMKFTVENLGDIVQLCISYQASVNLLSDKHNYIGLVYLGFIRYSYMFRLSTSAIIRLDIATQEEERARVLFLLLQ